jgi:hypothetical protein
MSNKGMLLLVKKAELLAEESKYFYKLIHACNQYKLLVQPITENKYELRHRTLQKPIAIEVTAYGFIIDYDEKTFNCNEDVSLNLILQSLGMPVHL